MEQLTLEQAAIEFAGGRNDPESKTAAQIKYSRIAGFKAGAEWQKEQLKAKWEAMSSIMENGLAKDLVDRVAAQLLQD